MIEKDVTLRQHDNRTFDTGAVYFHYLLYGKLLTSGRYSAG